MLFNSLEFVIFFVVVFLTYHIVLKERTKAQNVLLLIASYFFYGYANWKMLPLLVVTTAIYYWLGQGIAGASSEKRGNLLSGIGIVLGVGILLYFKYLNFFIESFAELFQALGLKTSLHTLNIIMPLGISFFTFRLISYVIEINWGAIEPSRDIVAFAVYVAFFPCILSGPIDRPSFMDQLHRKRVFNYDVAVDGLRQILWGLFKKVVVADNCAKYVDQVWGDYSSYSGSTLVLAAILYAVQLYADFSGYSDMAIGIGKTLGFRITANFRYPFFATNIADFWRRWHMSLTSWVTDYVFMPLNMVFRNLGKWGVILAIMINMLVVGMWHEANWTCFFYGLYHGLLFIPLILTGAFNKRNELKTNRLGCPTASAFLKMLLTFVLVAFSFIIFRADNIVQAGQFIGAMANHPFATPWLMDRHYYIPLFACIICLFVFEWIQRDKEFALDLSGIKSHCLKFGIYITLCGLIFWLGGEAETFIYFQF